MANVALEPPANPSAVLPVAGRPRLIAAPTPVVAGLAMAALIVVRWHEMGPYPTGLDGGQWLALGRGLLGGVGRSTDGVYAPLAPLLAALAAGAFGPIVGLRLLAMLSYAVVLVAVAVVARLGLGWPATITALLVAGSASAIVEPIAYGGYPQSLALAGMLLGCAALAQALDGRPKADTWAASAFAAAAATHHVYGPLALACGATIWALWILSTASRGRRRVGTRRTIVALAPGGFIAVALLAAFHAKGYAAPLDASGLGRIDAFAYATREATAVWVAILAGGVVSLVAVRHCRGPLSNLCAALIVVPGVLFVLVPEARLLPPMLVGGTLALLDGLSRLPRLWNRHRLVAPRTLAAALLLAIVVPAGDVVARDYFAYYRTLDSSLAAAAAAVQREADGGRVAVRADVRGWPIGWWLEGLTTARIVVGSDARWLGFPGERTAATTAGDFFDQRLSGDALRALARRTGVDLLVVRKREWIGWQRWLAEPSPPVTVVFDDGETLVLRIDSVQ
jgi:hypothetical protein